MKKVSLSSGIFPGNFSRWKGLFLFYPVFLLLFVSLGYGGQLDFGDYIRLEEGMSEGEVFARAGFPDREVYLNDFHLHHGPVRKRLFYIPGPEAPDPYVTVITVQGGRVSEMERTKLFSLPKRKFGGQMDFGVYRRLELGMSEGEILARAGRPDREEWIGTGPGAWRAFYYIPDREESDPFLTVVTLRYGEVVHLERTKIFSR